MYDAVHDCRRVDFDELIPPSSTFTEVMKGSEKLLQVTSTYLLQVTSTYHGKAKSCYKSHDIPWQSCYKSHRHTMAKCASRRFRLFVVLSESLQTWQIEPLCGTFYVGRGAGQTDRKPVEFLCHCHVSLKVDTIAAKPSHHSHAQERIFCGPQRSHVL